MALWATRTSKFTEVVAMVVNKETAEVENREVSIPKVFKKDTSLNEAVQEVLTEEDSNLKLVDIVSKKTTEKLMGVPEDIGNKYAVELDPKTRKPLPAKGETVDQSQA